jgi:hypothetical protein
MRLYLRNVGDDAGPRGLGGADKYALRVIVGIHVVSTQPVGWTMSDPIRFTIRAQNAETDAPTVEDLLGQIGDWNSILRGVEEAIAEDGASEIE